MMGRLGGSCRLLSGFILSATALVPIYSASDGCSGISCWTGGGKYIMLLTTRNQRQ